MAKQSGLGDNVYVNGFDLSGDITAVDQLSGGPGTIDATVINQFAHGRLPGQRIGVAKWTTLFDDTPTVSTPGFPASNTNVFNNTRTNVYVTITGGTLTSVKVNNVQVGTTAGTYFVPIGQPISITYSVAPTWNWFALGSEHSAFSSLPRADIVATYFRGQAVGSPAACIIGKQINYDPTRTNTGELTLQVEVDSNGFGLEWGKQLTPGLRTDTAATTGAFFDDGAGTAFGGQAYFELIGFIGTSITIDIQSATTSGGAYSTTGLTSQAFTSAPGSQRVQVANNVTINEFIKVVTTGTFTWAVFAVAYVRNLIAGQVF